MAKININHPFFNFINTLSAFIVLNILFIVTCLPVITIGAAITSLYSVMMPFTKDENDFLFKNYFKSFKSNFKESTIIWIILFIITSIILFNMSFWYSIGSLISTIIFALMGLVMIVLFLCFLYVFPLIVRFSNDTGQTIKNAIFIGFSHLKSSLILALLNGLFVYLTYIWTGFSVMSILLGFSFMAYIQSFIFNRIFKEYEPTTKSTSA